MNQNLCIYHRDADGCAAAAVVKLAHPDIQFDFVSAQYGEEDMPDCAGKKVIIVDFGYKPDVMLRLFQQAESVFIIDHHKTAMDDMATIMNDTEADVPKSRKILEYNGHQAVFDMNFSGATLVWDIYHPYQDIPVFLRYIQDIDLRTGKLKNSRTIRNGLQCYPLDVNEYAEMIQARWWDTCPVLLNAGTVITSYQDIQIEKALRRVSIQEFAGYTVPVLNHTDENTLSDVCGKMAVGYPFAVCYQDIADRRIYNLRSAKDGLDVSEIAHSFGGGGHKHAAGFVMLNNQHHLREES